MTPKPIARNTLYYGDNLNILRDYISDESIDLIYLDPPFNSNRSYNVLFKDESGNVSEAQLEAFDDTWHWGENAEETYYELITQAPDRIAKMVAAMREYIGTNQMMAYLVMMTVRLVELHRVLKSTGSLYLHCDPTASHYLKVILDTIFGAQNFRNEIIWQRTSSHNDSRKWGAVHDTLLFYSKTDKFEWNDVFLEYDQKYIDDFYTHKDEKGVYRLDHIIRTKSMGPRPNLSYEYKGYKPEWGWRVVRSKLEAIDADGRLTWSKSGRPYLKRYLHEQKGTPIKSVITDIQPLSAQSSEKLGYPTQKPLDLLERIIKASSKPEDWVLDPFCGCGTAIAAAQKLGRRWIGIDITHLAIALQKYRLKDMFDISSGKDYEIIGEPTSHGSAQQLAQDDPFQFQWWALSLVKAKPVGGEMGSKKGKKGKDRGIDGIINFIDNSKGQPESVIVQVKGGHVKSGDVRDLRGTVEREGAAIGVFITLEPSTSEMKKEAVSAGYYFSELWQTKYPKIQVLTIEELLGGAEIQMPPTAHGTFKQAPKANREEGVQGRFDL
jgi:site-specific DNA-methyltransferase (adenine-specific)